MIEFLLIYHSTTELCQNIQLINQFDYNFHCGTADSSQIRIYSTSTQTNHRLYSLMYDPVYRLGIAWQNAAYNQPHHLGFYIGDGVSNMPKPDVFIESIKNR